MEDKRTNSSEDQVTKAAPDALLPPKPDPALRRLDSLVGTWDITGRTLGSSEDNIKGQVKIAWLPGGFFLEQRGHMAFMDAAVDSLEIENWSP